MLSPHFLLAQLAPADVAPVTDAATSQASNSLAVDAILCGVGLVVAIVAGYWVGRQLHERGLDELLDPPWKPLKPRKGATRWPYSKLIGRGLMVTGCLTVVTVLFGDRHVLLGYLAPALSLIGQGWLLVVTTLVALGIAKMIASSVISIFDNKTVRQQLEKMFPHELPQTRGRSTSTPRTDETSERDMDALNRTVSANDGEPEPGQMEQLVDAETFAADVSEPAPTTAAAAESDFASSLHATKDFAVKYMPVAADESFADTLARLVGLLIYLIVFLPIFMIAAELWGWSTTSSSLSEIWQWLLPFVGMSAVVLIGWFAVTAAAVSLSPPAQRQNVMIGTTVLAFFFLTASFSTAFAIVFAVALLFVFWFTRNDISDLSAGLYLRAHKSVTVKTTDGNGQVNSVGLLTSEYTTLAGRYRARNRPILRSYLDGTLLDDAVRQPLETSP